ncbi:X2-like carbohydrate binding domain-containing protein [Clostridium beijerinckii]|uniref:Gellan lyase n=1 Tax=Clostridium beijerinckii TaxID=1520 RepID=A0A1S8RUR3_CLOBE|nr:X2-like carbohydrate binding domain-containing protein [Clostridium beijerinckii]NRY61720.1 putative repeat protein (TIGR02543 family) [Clostridium beijerinckii]OOM56946.1 gellan lyase precursor [Clostridium beijerinckii]
MKKKKFLSLVLVLVMLMTLIIPAGLPVYAVSTPDSYTFDISEGNITVAAGSTANTVKVTYGNSQMTTTDFTDTQEITIIGETTTNKVLVTGYITAKIKLRDADIELSDKACAFAIEGGANATLSLAGANTLSSYENAGLKVEDGQTVTIQDSDSDLGIGALDAKSNAYGAGIGGGDGTGGNITILSGTVNATGGKENLWWHGGNNGAGIGGGGNAMASGGNITIAGGTVTAIGGRCAAGIGGGSWGAGGNITISGGTVTATGGLVTSGIGGGYNGAPGNIKILNATVKAYSDGYQNAINANGNSLESGSDSDLICGKLNTSLSSTVSTEIDIVKSDNSSTSTLELPANYLSFATTVNGSGAYNIKTKESAPRIIANSSDNSTTFVPQHNSCDFVGMMIEQKSTVAILNDLKVNGATVSGFNSNTYTYDVILPAGTTSVPTVDATVTDTGKANAVVTSTASLPGPATIVVTAEDGTTKNTYTINFTVEMLSADSSLNNLVISQGTLSPAFSPATKNYTASVENGITNIKVTPTTGDSHAVLKVNGNTVISGNTSDNIPLNVGSNIINVIVTAQDGTTTTSYTVTVIRAATIPGAPMITSVVPGNGRADIYFTAPTSNGGSDITEYIVTSSPEGLTGTGLSSPISVTGLTNGEEYTFTVVAKNSVGLGEASQLSDIIIPQVPVMTGTVAITGTEKFGETLTAIPSISNGGTVTYQWNRDGVAIDGATGTTYKLVEADIGKIITVTITADEATGTGKITSTVTGVIAKADKAEAPIITNNPLDLTVNVGENAKLLIGGSGTGTLYYQWYSNTTNVNNGGTIIAGATNSSYEAPTTAAGTTYYYCTVTNTDSTAVESATINSDTARVTVNEIKDSTINPTIRNFDKNIENQADVITEMTLNGNTLISITNGINTLVNGIDYIVSGNTVTINREYLANQEIGSITLVFNFSSGNTQSLLIGVNNDTIVGEDDTTAPSINTISFVTNGGNVDIIPGTTGKVDLSSLIGESGPLTVTSAAVTLDISLKGQNDTDTKDNVEVELDFTTSRSNTVQSFGKYNGTLAETQSMLESMLAAFTQTLTTNQFKKIGGATFSLTDSKGNKSVYTIVTTANDTIPETYTVTFNSNGGSSIDPITGIASGTAIGTLPSAPVREGYTFEGWNTAVDGSGIAFKASSIVSANQIVYAQWKKINQSGSSNSGTGSKNNTTKPSNTSADEISDIDKTSESTKPEDNSNSVQNQIADNTQASVSEAQNEDISKTDENVETSTVYNQTTEPVAEAEEATDETTTESETPQQEAVIEFVDDNSEYTDESNLQSNDAQSSGEINADKKTGFRRFLPSFERNIFSDNLPAGPTIDLNIDISVDSKVGGRAIMATAKGLKSFSEVKIIVYSEARVLAIGKADANGNAVITGTFPDDLEPAQHTIMAIGVGKEGQDLQTIGGFKISDSGTVTAVSHPGQVITPLEPNSPRLTRAVDAGKPLYDAARYPGVVATVMISITAFLGLAGTNGLAGRSLNGKSPSTKKSKAKLAGVATKKLKMLKSSEAGWGDNQKTWAFPGTSATDLWGSTIPNKIGKFSAVASRVIVDGSWSRAMFGSAGYILWIIGAILGGISAYSVNFMALPPALPMVFAIVALGILDSAAGASAWIVITFCAIVTGNVTAWADIQTLLGIFVLFSSLPLLAHCIRPLRRGINGDLKEIFDRAADYIMPPVSLALAASSMIKALNGLSGLELYTADEYNKVRLIVGAVFILRIFLEDIVTYLYPIRSTKVQPEKLVSVSNRVQWMSVVMKVLVFILISHPFFGVGWLIFFVAVITAIPNAMKIYEDNFPNFKLLHKLYPRGNLKFTIFTIIGIYLAAWLSKQGTGDEWAKQTYIILLLPGFISSCIEFFAREGGSYWPNPWLKRIMGIGVWSLSVGLALGIINLV